MHNLLRLAEKLRLPKDLQRIAADLTPDATITRYPDIAGATPAELYDKTKAQEKLKSADRLLKWLFKQMK
ncbi:MAG: HEPN domain-containing protein [Candidatus Aenigmarchaeota archaeon]|nr:HEPN domain-containing protein [Candidatus Aenigmarchaeota archaeon]